MHLVIHIGPYKTATSYLQTCLHEKAAALGNIGIHVASQWNDSPLNPSHTGLVQRLNSERKHELQSTFAQWRAERHRMVVVSCEDLSSIGPIQVLMLSELTAGIPVSIIYYVRRWSELLASEWQEYVKQGSTLPLIDVLAHNLLDPIRSRIINIDATVGVFARFLGKSAIRLVSYDSVLEEEGDLFTHFTKNFLGNPPLPATKFRIVNPSLAPAQTELLRIFNCLDQEFGARHCHRMLRFLELQHGPAPMTKLLDHIGQYVRTLDLDDDAPAVRETLARNRSDYAECAVLPAAAQSFYPSKTTQFRFISPDYALAPGFAEAARQLRLDLLAIG